MNEKLGVIAFKFRGTRDEEERKKLAKEYADEVEKLTSISWWLEMPAFEDMLPDEHMPQRFFDYWSLTRPSRL